MRVQNRTNHRSIRGRLTGRGLISAAILVALIGLAGCSSTNGISPEEEVVRSEFAGAPDWVLKGCSAYWGDEGDEGGARLCGVGDAKVGRNLSIARTKAGARGRTEISRTLETKVMEMVKDYQEQVSDSEAEMTAEQFSTTTVSLSKSTLNGTALQDSWNSPNGRLYMLMALDVESFENSIREMDGMSDRMRQFIESSARKSFRELDEEIGED